MDFREVLAAKRDGGALTREQIEYFLRGYTSGEIPDYQASALLTAIFIHGLDTRELEQWTRGMLHSGSTLDFAAVARPKADKHSTGGVGDKVSIPLAPAVAACGLAVPMISGRGLGHTGGTLDKLEAIPGFRTQLAAGEFGRVLAETGVALGGQTPELVPADRKLYALRDVTGLIESVPLIASSILSKKLAEGIEALVLDVKFGSGAFLREPERGAELARTMLRLAGSMGVRATAFQTSMERPLGKTAGHALEIEESLECLRGGGPADLRELVCLQGGEMLHLCSKAATTEDGARQVSAALDDGRALAVFRRVVEAQGGDPRVVDEPAGLPRAPGTEALRADRSGVLSYADVRRLGHAICALGGGRLALGDEIDPAVGLRFLRSAGERVAAGEPLIEIHHRAGRGLAQAREHLRAALAFDAAKATSPLVLARITS
jgi:pyrimidine-nucleoside phosphorylase